VVTIIIDNNGSQTTGGQSCETPEIFGSGVVKDWEKRFAGTVAINKPDEVVGVIKKILAPTTDENILIVDFNKGGC